MNWPKRLTIAHGGTTTQHPFNRSLDVRFKEVDSSMMTLN